MSQSRAIQSSMTPAVRQLMKDVARGLAPVLWATLLLIALAGGGYYLGSLLQDSKQLEWLPWAGAAIGAVLFAIVRPRLRPAARRSSGAATSKSGQTTVYHDEHYIDDGSWFGDSDDSYDSE